MNAYKCADGHLFPCSASLTREHSEYLPGMYDRPGDYQLVTHPACPICGSEELVSAHLCRRCEAVEPMAGADECSVCDAITEQEESAAIRRKSREARHADLLSVLVDVARGTP